MTVLEIISFIAAVVLVVMYFVQFKKSLFEKPFLDKKIIGNVVACYREGVHTNVKVIGEFRVFYKFYRAVIRDDDFKCEIGSNVVIRYCEDDPRESQIICLIDPTNKKIKCPHCHEYISDKEMVCSKCGKVIDYYEVVISPRTWLKGFPLFKFYLKEIFVKNSMMWFSIIFLYIIVLNLFFN